VSAAGEVRGLFAATAAAALHQTMAYSPLRAVAVDIPVGLPDSGVRQADRRAREALGQRRSTLFLTPVREAVLCPDYQQANKINRDRAGLGISRQAYGLRRAILQVEALLAEESVLPASIGHPSNGGETVLVETHPELCFAEMHGQPLAVTKKTWDGATARRSLLARHGIELPEDLGELGKRAAVDDVLDAAAAAWTAKRVAEGAARSLPGEPQVFSDGWPAAIWV
jgi:predicted RNase H-like nuclease